MHKPSLLILLVGAVGLSGCIITSTDNGDDGSTSPTTDPTQGGTDTSDPSTSGPDETGDDETTEDPDDTGADETGSPASCGWGPTNDPEVPEGYVCGGDGEDPDNRWGIECPEGLEEDAECGELTGVGCCDADGNVWFCWDEAGTQTLVKEDC
jgi:hypothetical protein